MSSTIKIQRALISVHDKSGLGELLGALNQYGCEFVSTGGTAKLIREAGYTCQAVEEVTGFPEILDGRVKTLHPKIFGGILSRDSISDRAELTKNGIQSFQLVVVNLYPFVEQLAAGHGVDRSHMLEYIDIGGVSLIRAAAKNYPHCLVVTSPSVYHELIGHLKQHNGAVSVAYSAHLAQQAFAITSTYDAQIADYLAQESVTENPPMNLLPVTMKLRPVTTLSYGENPHQKAGLYLDDTTPFLLPQQLQGKPLSYNNMIDVDGCLGVLGDFLDRTACVIVKHANPCGIGIAKDQSLVVAYENALAGDPVSAFGGIVGFTRPVDGEMAKQLVQKFYEIIIAPEFSKEALQILQTKSKLRLLQLSLTTENQQKREPHKAFKAPIWRQTLSGYLWQERDQSRENVADAKVVTKRQPTPAELSAMQMAWSACKWVKSNAIVLANAQRTCGIGAGQMSRVDAVELAIRKAQPFTADVALASDAFFPFRDSIDFAAKAGIRAIVQPGGSMRDQEVIDAADQHGIAMVFTGVRHFRH
jgi:phosphoribosylaminoimidazolecarboxamide formyltransferase/IMP cyclohydrolase